MTEDRQQSTRVAPRSATYQRAVKRIRNAHERREDADPWRIGDWTLKVAPVGQSGIANGTRATLELLSEDTEVAVKTLRDHRRVAEAWPRAERSALHSWAVHRVLVRREDRFEYIKALDAGITEREVKGKLKEERDRLNASRPDEAREQNTDVPGRSDDPLTALEAALAALTATEGTLRVAADRLQSTWLDEEEVRQARVCVEGLQRLASEVGRLLNRIVSPSPTQPTATATSP